MKYLKLVLITALMTTIHLASAADPCADASNARKKLAAQTLAKNIQKEISGFPTDLDGFESVSVGAVGTGKDTECDTTWALRLLGMRVPESALIPTCGVVYTFSDEDGLKAFAKSKLALYSQNSIPQALVKVGHTGNSVGSGDMEHFNIAYCAKLKK